MFSSLKFGDDVQRETIKEKNSGNILFLDFDGVCNSFRNGSYITHKPNEYGVDNDIIDRIKEICSLGNARIVISSNWRRFEPDGYWIYNGNRYFNPLPGLYRILGDRIIGTLTKDRGLMKSQALELWFEDNEYFHGKFAILDDDTREGFQNNTFMRKNFWLTDPRLGLTEKIKKEIIDHLEGN